MTSLRFEIPELSQGKIYKPGDLVSGLIHLNISHEAAQNAKRIEVAFSGRSEISYTITDSQWKDKAPWHGNGRTVFFDQLQIVCVYDPSHLPVLGGSQWPFSFVFPALTSSDQQLRRWGTSANLPTTASEPDIPLPPSYLHFQDGWSSTVSPESVDLSQGSASVIYELEARLVTAQGTYISHSNQSLTFLPYNRLPATQPSYMTQERSIRCESRRLLANVDHTSFRSRAKSLMHKTPVSVFRLIVEVPTFSVAGEPFPLYIGIKYDQEKSTLTELPPVYLRLVKIKYIEHVCLGHRQPVYTTDRVQTIEFRRRFRILQHRVAKDKNIQLTERMDLRDYLPPEPLRVADLSFETLNIKRSFLDLFVEVIVACAGVDYSTLIPFGQRGSIYPSSIYPFIAPAPPPKSVEIPDSNPLPSEAQGKAVYEAETKVAAGEAAGKSIYEAEVNAPLRETAGRSVYEADSKIVPGELAGEPIQELDGSFH